MRCLLAFAMVPSTDVVEAVWIRANLVRKREEMLELRIYSYIYTYIRRSRRPERNECYLSAAFPKRGILKVNRKKLLEIQSKAGFTGYKRYFSVITQSINSYN